MRRGKLNLETFSEDKNEKMDFYEMNAYQLLRESVREIEKHLEENIDQMDSKECRLVSEKLEDLKSQLSNWISINMNISTNLTNLLKRVENINEKLLELAGEKDASLPVKDMEEEREIEL